MTDNTKPDALRLADWLDTHSNGQLDYKHKVAAELRRQHDRIAELEAQLESIGAGGVSGPLMGCASIAASAGSEPVARVNDDGFILEIGDLPIAPGQKLYLHPSPPEGMVAEQALRKVLSVVQRYLPPDGPTAHDAMTEITEIVDPWPLGPMEKP